MKPVRDFFELSGQQSPKSAASSSCPLLCATRCALRAALQSGTAGWQQQRRLLLSRTTSRLHEPRRLFRPSTYTKLCPVMSTSSALEIDLQEMELKSILIHVLG